MTGLQAVSNFLVPATGTTNSFAVHETFSSSPHFVDFRNVELDGNYFRPYGVLIDNQSGTGDLTVLVNENSFRITCAAGGFLQLPFPAPIDCTANITGLGEATVIFVDFPVMPFQPSGAVNITLPNPLPVSGPLTDTQIRATALPVSGPLTDTQIRATALPVSGPLTDTQIRATALPVSGPLTDTQIRAMALPVKESVTAASFTVIGTTGAGFSSSAGARKFRFHNNSSTNSSIAFPTATFVFPAYSYLEFDAGAGFAFPVTAFTAPAGLVFMQIF